MSKFKNLIKSSVKSILPAPVVRKVKSLIIPPGFIEFSGGWVDPVQFNEDGMATAHSADFTKSNRFKKAYAAGLATLSWGPSDRSGIRWRVFNALTLSKYALRVPGEFVECGTNRGGTAAAILNYVDFVGSKKSFYLLDTFAGFDPDMLTTKEREGIEEYQKRYTDCYEDVKKTFAPFPFVNIIKGSVPGTLAQVKAEKVAFLHLDMNCSTPERDAIEFFWDRLSPGAVVLLDDYGWVNHEEQKKTMDEFAKSKGIEVVEMPTGQGMILKPYW